MSPTNSEIQRKRALYVGLVLIFIVCLWVGWSDVDIPVSQDEVREGIRSTIRQLIQISIQFIIPAAILAFFVKEIRSGVRSKTAQRNSDV